MKKPLIGLVPLIDNQRESYWMLPGYMKGITMAGGIPIMLPLTIDNEEINQISQEFDGFLFTGGHDVSPTIYGEDIIKECGEICEERDRMELLLLDKVLKEDKPVLGICRGIQLINVALGGTLYQDLSVQHPSQIEHHQKPPYDIPVHEIEIKRDSPLYELLGKDSELVNSYHHQAIKKLSSKLKPMAYSKDGLIEAIYMPNKKFVWAVQYHPEFLFETHKDFEKIFEIFICNAK